MISFESRDRIAVLQQSPQPLVGFDSPHAGLAGCLFDDHLVSRPDTELVSHADAFAVALAERLRRPLITGDPEILALDREVDVIDPREGHDC